MQRTETTTTKQFFTPFSTFHSFTTADAIVILPEPSESKAKRRRALHSRNVVIGLALAVFTCSTAISSVIVDPAGHYLTDPFTTDDSTSWKADTGSNVGFAWTSTGGSPLPVPVGVPTNTGYMAISDAQNKTMVVIAPSQFGGTPWGSSTVDLSRFNRPDGVLYFDAFVSKIKGSATAVLPNFGVITITGNGLTASTDVGSLPITGGVWTRLGTPFTSSAWKVGTDPNAVGAVAISSTNWATLLQSVNAITVDLSLASSSSDVVAFDNFTLADTPEPTSVLLMAGGFVGLFAARKRLMRQ